MDDWLTDGALSELGYTPQTHERFIEEAQPLSGHDVAPARVMIESVDRFRIATAGGECDAILAIRSGALTRPAVGDWVVAASGDRWATATIRHVLERDSVLSRRAAGQVEREQVIAANVDVVFIVMGLDGDYNLRRLERFLVTVSESGADAVVVLTKADLADDPIAARLDAVSVAPGVPVHAVSAPTGGGLEALKAFLAPGLTIAMVGSSGAGKSTLLNALDGSDVMQIGDVRESDSHGRHTTTYRRLVPLSCGGLVVDTPGMREVQLWADADAVDDVFPEIEELAAGCRFRDCGHVDEPGCAVAQAIEDGDLAGDRLASWLKLRTEIRDSERRRDVAASRADGRRLGRYYKQVQKDGRRLKGGP